jgi:putative ubiquitin-RnfH superfamily antitoxin RatB of RatAB toxin-antitoxin module
MTGHEKSIKVEVVLAMPQQQELVALEVSDGTTVEDAVGLSGLLEMFEDFEFDTARVGIFGQKVATDHVLRDGDRVELYRPLIADPKEVRRQRALKQAKP